MSAFGPVCSELLLCWEALENSKDATARLVRDRLAPIHDRLLNIESRYVTVDTEFLQQLLAADLTGASGPEVAERVLPPAAREELEAAIKSANELRGRLDKDKATKKG